LVLIKEKLARIHANLEKTRPMIQCIDDMEGFEFDFDLDIGLFRKDAD